MLTLLALLPLLPFGLPVDRDGDGHTAPTFTTTAKPVAPPVLALVRWLFGARPNLDGDPYWMRADCDDSDPTVYPGAPEIPADGKDNDCDPTTLDDDLDGDGVSTDEDCDDSDPARWLWYCYDDDKDGTWDADSPMPKVCGSVAVPPPDPNYLACGA